MPSHNCLLPWQPSPLLRTHTYNALAAAHSPPILSAKPPPRPLSARAERRRRILIAPATREPRQPPAATVGRAGGNSCAICDSSRCVSGPREAAQGHGHWHGRWPHSRISQSELARLLDPEWFHGPLGELHIASTPAEQRHIHVIQVRRYTRRDGQRQHTISFCHPSGRQRKPPRKEWHEKPVAASGGPQIGMPVQSHDCVEW